MLFLSISVWATVSFWLMRIGHASNVTWSVALLAGVAFVVLLIQRLLESSRAIRALRDDPRLW